MSFGIPIRNGLAIGLLASTFLSSRSSRNIVPSLILNFTDGIYRSLGVNYAFSELITFSRTTNATLVDSTGRVTYAPNNLLLYSEQFDNAAWSKSDATVTANNSVAPDGTITADTLADTVANTSHNINQTYASFTSGTTYTFTIFAKAGTATVVQILGSMAAFGANVWANFNLSTGVVGSVGTLTTASITPFGNGWYRCTITGAATATSSGSVSVNLTNSSATAVRGVVYVGSGQTTFIWGAQLEAVTYQTLPSTYKSTSPPNLFGFTEEFNNAYWTKAGATISPDATAAPNGSTTADKLVEDSSTGQHRFYGTAASTTNTGSYTVSFFAKAAERTRVYVGVAESPTFVRQGNAVFDLSAGTVVSANAGSGGASGGSATIQDAGNGWYRCSYTLILGGANTSIFVDFNLVSTGVTISYTGNGTSGLFLWGAQLSNSASVDPYVYNPGAAPTSTAYYGPRFDYNPVTLAPNGLLIEEQRVNLVTYSEQFNDASWTKSSGVITADASISPDGTQNADIYTQNIGTTGEILRAANIAVTANADFSISGFFKAVSTTPAVSLYATAGGNGFRVVANLSTGAVVSSGALGTGTFTAGSVRAFGNGWYLVSATGKLATGVTTGQWRAAMIDLALNPVVGDGAKGLGLWGAQLEAGAFATSYIPTVASTVTRAADIASMTGTNFSSWYNQSEGTLFSTFQRAGSSNSGAVLGSNDNTTNNRIQIRATNATTVDNFIILSGSSNFFQSFTVLTNAITKAALGYKTNDPNSAVNGVAGATDTSEVIPIGLTTLGIGNVTSSGFLNGYIRTLTYYRSRLTNAQLQALTA